MWVLNIIPLINMKHLCISCIMWSMFEHEITSCNVKLWSICLNDPVAWISGPGDWISQKIPRHYIQSTEPSIQATRSAKYMSSSLLDLCFSRLDWTSTPDFPNLFGDVYWILQPFLYNMLCNIWIWNITMIILLLVFFMSLTNCKLHLN